MSKNRERLNVGCGRQPKEGWCNIDSVDGPGVDFRVDVDGSAAVVKHRFTSAGFKPDSVKEFALEHVIEHVHDQLGMMEALHWLAAPGATMTVRCPHGASDDAWEDPTHVRPMFPASFLYFSQSIYWRADYGYRGDWWVVNAQLLVPETFVGMAIEDVHACITHERNVVREMIVTLEPVKPVRTPGNGPEDVDHLDIVLTGVEGFEY